MATEATIVLLIVLLLHLSESALRFVKRAHLAPNQIAHNGAYIIQSINVENRPANIIGENSYNWIIQRETVEKGWHFIINLDDSYAFDQEGISSITMTLNEPPNYTNSIEMLYFGFTTSYNQAEEEYIAVEIPMSQFVGPQGFHFWAKTYPQCGSIKLAKGDVAAQIVDNRQCDLANGNCNEWGNMTPFVSPYFPIKITLENDVARDELMIYINDQISFCTFKALDFVPRFFNNGLLKIYVAANNFDTPFIVSSFNIEAYSNHPTQTPTQSPTYAPTIPTHSPTKSPSKHPSVSPTQTPTNPTNNPSVSPTKYPTTDPTNSPTLTPTESPTRSPSFSPSDAPSSAPSKNPTPAPTAFPTLSPSFNPTNNPTQNPSLQPTRSPSKNPTFHPSNYPSRSPTHYPSRSPTSDPTPAPTNNPSLSPTLNPTQSPSNAPTPSPTDTPTEIPTESTLDPTNAPTAAPTDMPTRFPTETTDGPTVSPTNVPTESTQNPSLQPTLSPVTTTTVGMDESTTDLLESILSRIQNNEAVEETKDIWIVAAVVFAGLFILTCCCAVAVCFELACGPFGLFGFKKLLTNESFSMESIVQE